MTRELFDRKRDVDSEAETARRRDFIERMERKLQFKQSVRGADL